MELVLRGGAKKTYQTADFLGMTPLNLSVNFRLKVPFGIGYGHQQDATVKIPELLSAFIQQKIEEEGYAQDLLNLKVEFAEAGASSLDLVVITDFKGDQAPIYNRLKRSIQRWCVDAASQYNWDIPLSPDYGPPGGLIFHHKAHCCVLCGLQKTPKKKLDVFQINHKAHSTDFNKV